MAQIEEKEVKGNKYPPKKKKGENKANTKPQEQPKEETVVVTEEKVAKPEEKKVYPEYHASRVGDNPFNLAKMYDTTMEAIKELNPNTDWLNMKAGTKVRIK